MSHRRPRVRGTPAAISAITALTRRYGHLVIVQSAGPCDGSTPLVLRASDFRAGVDDVHVGDVANVPVYVPERELRGWPDCEIRIDVERGYADGLSLTPGDGSHLVTRSSACAPVSEGSEA